MPTATTTMKNLYMAKSMDELQKKGILPDMKDPNKLVKVSKKLLDGAQSAKDSGDEEKAYVMFFKYVELANFIRKTREYQKDKVYFDSMVSKKSVLEAVEHLEALNESLKHRYQLIEEEKVKLKEKSPSPKLVNGKTPSPTPIKTVVEEKEEEMSYVVDPMRLYSIINEKATSFMLLDARPAADYKVSRISHPASINVPAECLTKGTTVKVIERQIRIEDRDQWTKKRSSVDMLILYDWSSEDFVPGTPLTVLKDAMYHWDKAAGTVYTSKVAFILKGGFENFAMSYPMIVTNPQKSRPPTSKGQRLTSAINIDSVEYPDLDVAFISTPNASPAVASGAITVSSSEMEAINSPSKPKIPDRKSKPQLDSSDSLSSWSGKQTTADFDRSVSSELNKAVVMDDSVSSNSNKQPPPVDRSLKAKALIRSEATTSQNDVLEAEKDIVEDSLRLENEELKMEEEWEKLRLKRENAVTEELRLQVMKREEELMERLEKLSAEKEAKDEENRALLRQLEAMKIRLKAKDEDKRVEEEIERAKREKDQRREHVEKLRRERRRKQEQELRKMAELQEQQKRSDEARRKREETERAIHQKIVKVPLKREEEQGSRGGGGLNRSHSSPNIAKMLEDEDQANNAAIIPTPKFDRSSKPAASEVKSRNFAGVWGNSKKGLTGLRNLGNTCYMNSLLQCLSNFTIPSQYFIGETFKRDLNRSSETKGEIAIEFAEVIRMLWSGQYKSIAPYDFKRTVGKFNEKFRGSDQQDADELLYTLMEALHQDVNMVRKKVKLPEQNNDNIPEIEAAKKAWDMEKINDQSFIRETFYGQQRSTLTCPFCGWFSVTYESFFELPLKLPFGNKRCSLRQLIETYLSKEEVPYKCPTCKKDRQCVKQFEIVKLPLILTVSLGRFYNDGLSRKKQNFVDFELNDVNLGQYVTGCQGQLNRYLDYTLYGVCNHFGSLESGHYTAFCYSQVYRKWYKYDDTEVYEVDASDIKSPAAYILFYSAKN